MCAGLHHQTETRCALLASIRPTSIIVVKCENLLPLRPPMASHELARLRLGQIVTTRRDGKAVYYSLANDDVRRMITVIYDRFCGPPKPRLPSDAWRPSPAAISGMGPLTVDRDGRWEDFDDHRGQGAQLRTAAYPRATT